MCHHIPWFMYRCLHVVPHPWSVAASICKAFDFLWEKRCCTMTCQTKGFGWTHSVLTPGVSCYTKALFLWTIAIASSVFCPPGSEVAEATSEIELLSESPSLGRSICPQKKVVPSVLWFQKFCLIFDGFWCLVLCFFPRPSASAGSSSTTPEGRSLARSKPRHAHDLDGLMESKPMYR